MPIERETYRRINEAFPKKLAYHLGSRSGFFAEYVNMLQAIVYCLQNNIQFQLYSKDANFATHHGWTDFFEPFCVEQTCPLHRILNPRFPSPKFKFKLRKACAPTLKMLSKCDHLGYEIWEGLRANDFDDPHLSIHSLKREGSAIEVYSEISNMIWNLKAPVKEKINTIRGSLELPPEYGALHIRSGDKIKEAQPYPLGAYMDKLKKHTDAKDIFVMTDDYDNISQLIKDYPNQRFHTLENESQSGYHHRVNKRRTTEEKQLDYLNLLAGIETAVDSAAYIGTFSSSVSTFIRLQMDNNKCHALDA